jgi:hypothetical protein
MKWIVAIVAIFAAVFAALGAISARDDNADGRESAAFFARLALVALGIDGALLFGWILFRMFTT